MTKIGKIFLLKKSFFGKKQYTVQYLSLSFHEGLPSYTIQKPPALKREHPVLQKQTLPTWIRIRIQPTKINVDPCGSAIDNIEAFARVWIARLY